MFPVLVGEAATAVSEASTVPPRGQSSWGGNHCDSHGAVCIKAAMECFKLATSLDDTLFQDSEANYGTQAIKRMGREAMNFSYQDKAQTG
ncbi:hypothetical protein E2562_032421 [Oryza meyeriana var. granulata]|uniref:Uncharacterized protein n=1 Tax=Oryza meyeriana var. granulata TaxID=110450 RepID=A0A6G1CVJ7_9ORYZ|nr:hypothetical protein E2562_032421 [Oryza meyeriana var. granulata]